MTNQLGNFIKQKRKERDLTQHQLAEFADVSFTFINRVENGDTNVTLKKLNQVLNIFGHEVSPSPIKKAEPSDTALEKTN